MSKQVRVGVGVIVCKEGKILIQQRQGAHGAGTWAPPGGHLEFGESFEQTATREVLEETGIEIANIRFAAVTNDYFSAEDKHYVTVWMLSDWTAGEPTIVEPEKCLSVGWYGLETLPSPMFLPWSQLLESEFIDAIRDAVADIAES